MMRTRVAAICIALLVLVVACGAPKSGGFTEIDRKDIPPSLTATTSTSTSTTTTMPETTTTVEQAAVTTTTIFVPPPTTIASALVRLYYVVGKEKIVSIDATLARDPSVSQVMTALESAPTGAGTDGLRTALPSGEEPNPVDNGRGLVTIDISGTFKEAAGEDQRLAIAQIVLTFTHLNGISQVRFTMDGEPVQVLLADGTLSEPDAILYGKDFESLLDSATPTTTATTTTAPATPESTDTSSTVEQPTTLPSG